VVRKLVGEGCGTTANVSQTLDIMKTTKKLKDHLVGFAVDYGADGKVPICFRDVSYSDEGPLFIERMEQLQDALFSRFPEFPSPSSIDSLLVLINPNGDAEAIINELKLVGRVAVTRAVRLGAPVFYDDIAHFDALDIGVEIPPAAGFVLMVSNGWRKVVMFDFSPLLEPPQPRGFHCPSVFGTVYSQLLFLEQMRLTEQSWEYMFSQGWFPFRFLPHDALKKLLRLSKDQKNLVDCLTDETVNTIAKNASSSDLIDATALSPHRDLLVRAFERFSAQDYVSTVSILYPRIEGIFRTLLQSKGATSSRLKDIVTQGAAEIEESASPQSLLVPHRFATYIRDVLFREWSQGSAAAHVSRHTVSHGVAPQEAFDRTCATVAVLSMLQLGLYLRVSKSRTEVAPSGSTP
jgi:hypothetical protein